MIYDQLKTTFGDKYLSQLNISICFNKFLNERELTDNDLQPNKPPTLVTNEHIAKNNSLVRSNRRLITKEMISELDLSSYAVQSNLNKDLNTHWVCAKFIPKQ